MPEIGEYYECRYCHLRGPCIVQVAGHDSHLAPGPWIVYAARDRERYPYSCCVRAGSLRRLTPTEILELLL